MEIRTNLSPMEGATGAQPSNHAQTGATAARNGARLPEDSASLSSAGNLAAQAMTVPDVRMDKVQAVQQALAEGSYSVRPDAVAGKLIDHLLGK